MDGEPSDEFTLFDIVDLQTSSPDQLPSNKDVLGYIYYLRNSQQAKLSDSFPEVIKKVTELWKRTPIPILSSYSSMQLRLKNLLKRFQTSKRNIALGRDSKPIELSYLNELFYIGKCLCVTQTGSPECNCAPPYKIPPHVIAFTIDQLGPRQLKISDLQNQFEQHEDSFLSMNSLSLEDDRDEANESANGNRHDAPKSVAQINLQKVAREAIRFQCSQRATAAITSRVLESVGFVGPTNTRLVIDRSKIQREMNKVRASATENACADMKSTPLQSFFFDGKCERVLETLCRGKSTIKKISSHKKENVTIVREPDNKFLGFISAPNAEASEILDHLKKFFQENDIALNHLIAIGCDGAGTNTGWEYGILQGFEQYIGRPVHWLVCLFHLNELPFKTIFTTLDGGTKSGKEYSGPIGRKLDSAHTLPVVQFSKIPL